jgi:hypothetical protein
VRGTVLLPSGILGTRGAHDVDASRPCGARQTPAHGRAVRDARARGLPEPRAKPALKRRRLTCFSKLRSLSIH